MDGRTPDRYITLTPRQSQPNNNLSVSTAIEQISADLYC